MTALSDALAAAQSRALAQLQKEYVRSQYDEAERVGGFRDALAAIEVDSLIACLEVLRVTGGALPAEPTTNGRPRDEPATDSQLALVKRLAAEKGQPPPDAPLTKAQAHEVIDTLKAGTYDAGRWVVPF